MSKVAIVGVEGSGKTVLMGALCECYKQISDDAPYLMPENQAAFMFMERIPHKLRVEREWPEATNVSSLKSMRWTLRLGKEVLEEIEMLDYPGELYRIAFGEHKKEEVDAHREELDEFLEHVTGADTLIVLLNIADILDLGANARNAETVWITRGIFDFAMKVPNIKRTALVFTQADRFEATLKANGGAQGLYAKQLPMLKTLYPDLKVMAVSAVSGMDGDGRPKKDYSTAGCLKVMREILAEHDAGILRCLGLCDSCLVRVNEFSCGSPEDFSAVVTAYTNAVADFVKASKPLTQVYAKLIEWHEIKVSKLSQMMSNISSLCSGTSGDVLAEHGTWSDLRQKYEAYGSIFDTFVNHYKAEVNRLKQLALNEEENANKRTIQEAKEKRQMIVFVLTVVSLLVILFGWVFYNLWADKQKRTEKVAVLWTEALYAKEAGNWQGVIAATEGVLAIRPGNAQVLALKRGAETAARSAKERADADYVRPAGDTSAADLGDGVKLEMVWCPSGSFMMGSPESEADRNWDETQHRVTLTKGFWMGKTEVTQRQWMAVMGSNPSTFKGTDLPVEGVSWEDCQEFCKKLNEKLAGGRYRLPTEAEWEYACRAGTTGPYAGKLDDVGWSSGISEGRTHEVGQKRANAWGLYDMHGNVREWCQDWYDRYPGGNVIDPAGAMSGSYRVLRGGSWYFNAYGCRSAYRYIFTSDLAYSGVGFRAVLPQGQP